MGLKNLFWFSIENDIIWFDVSGFNEEIRQEALILAQVMCLFAKCESHEDQSDLQ